MEYQDFLSSIKAGQYVKVKCRNDNPGVRKVTKVTKTQIVITECSYGDEDNTDRFRISNGCRIGDNWRYLNTIIAEPVSPEEATAYESVMAEREWMRKERKRLREIEDQAKAKLFALFKESVPVENIKVSFSSRDGMKTGSFEIKCEGISEHALVSILGVSA